MSIPQELCYNNPKNDLLLHGVHLTIGPEDKVLEAMFKKLCEEFKLVNKD